MRTYTFKFNSTNGDDTRYAEELVALGYGCELAGSGLVVCAGMDPTWLPELAAVAARHGGTLVEA